MTLHTSAEESTPQGQVLSWGAQDTVFGPNEIVTIDIGNIAYISNCVASQPNGGIDDFLFPAADIYVVPSGSIGTNPFDPNTTTVLRDVSEVPNTVIGSGGGAFVSEQIAITAPSGSVPAGTYAVVYDECQDGNYDPGLDALFDPAFSVEIPADVPILPDLQALKSEAGKEADYWKEALDDVVDGFLIIELTSLLSAFFSVDYPFHRGCISPGSDPGSGGGCVFNDAIIMAISASLGFLPGGFQLSDPKIALQQLLLNTSLHWKGIQADPPDPNFERLAWIAPHQLDEPKHAALEDEIIDFSKAAVLEGETVLALLQSLERYQGAQLAGNGEWALLHARSIQTYANLLVGQLSASENAVSDLIVEIQNDGRDFDSLASEVDAVRTRILSDGYTESEKREAANAGLTVQELDGFKELLADVEASSWTTQSWIGSLETLRVIKNDTRATLLDFATSMEPIITQLEDESGVIGLFPAPAISHPSSVPEGVVVDFDASLSTSGPSIVLYEWDLNLDGLFDDAIGPIVSHSFDQEQDTIVGLRVTNASGFKAIVYSSIRVTNVDSTPTISSFSPSLSGFAIEVGNTVEFSVSADDPEGATVEIGWLVDDLPSASGSTFTFVPTTSQVGRHRITATVDDGSSLGGPITHLWRIIVVVPDEDGDGWRANADCEDGNPSINPGTAEVLLNGLDDDCNPATSDTGNAPIADFAPAPVPTGRNVALAEAGATIVDFSSQYSAGTPPASMLDHGIEDRGWITAGVDDQFAIIDLVGDEHLINGVAILPRRPLQQQRVRQFAIDVSTTTTDPSAFTEVFTGEVANLAELQHFSFPRPASARYVRYRPVSNYGDPSFTGTEKLEIFSATEGGATVAFENLSSDVNDDIVSVEWDFGDGNTSVEFHPEHTYDSPGTYDVRLRVEDGLGLADEVTLSQTVLAPPVVDVTLSPAQPNEAEDIAFTVDAIDPDGGGILAVTFSWGDGSNDTTSMDLVVTHRYIDDGMYTVTATVSDLQGQTTQSVFDVHVANVVPSLSIIDDGIYHPGFIYTVQAGTPLNIATAQDDPARAADSLWCTWDFGDGETLSGFCFPPSFVVAHVYQVPGVYQLTVTADDGDGGRVTQTGEVAVFSGPEPIELTELATEFNDPIGIDHHEPTNTVILSVHYPTGDPYNFERVLADGSREHFSDVQLQTDELKIATVKSSFCQGGFEVGELFSGTGRAGELVRVSADGSSAQVPWITLPNEEGLLRGGIYQDINCVVDGDLVVATTQGGIWRVTSAGEATRIAHVGEWLEGVIVLPDDSRYGPWAGLIVAGAENVKSFYTVDPDVGQASIRQWKIGIAPEDIDIVIDGSNFFGVDRAGRALLGAPASEFDGLVGDLIIVQETPARLYHVRWNEELGFFERSLINTEAAQWEHVTFSSAPIAQISAGNRSPISQSKEVATVIGEQVTIVLEATDPDGDPLTFTVVEGPDNGSISMDVNGQVVYSPEPGFTGIDQFTFIASDGSLESFPATITINVQTLGTIIVEKQTDPDGAAGDFEFTGDASGIISDDGQIVVSDLAPGTYSSQEIASAPGFELSGINCDDSDSIGDVASHTATYQLDAGEVVTCVFTSVSVNAPPIANDDEVLTDEDVSTEVNVVGNDEDPDNNLDASTVNVLDYPVSGSLLEGQPGIFTYTPEADFSGSDSFTYEVCDVEGLCDSASVTIVVTPVNDSPTVVVDTTSVTVEEGQVASNSGTATDVDNDNLTFSASVGTLVPAQDGTWSWEYQTSDGPGETQVITITVEDGNGGISETSFVLTVTNADPVASFNVPADVDEGDTFKLALSNPQDAGPEDVAAGFTFEFDCGNGDGLVVGSSNTTQCSTDNDGIRTAQGRITDKDGASALYTAVLTIHNVAPEVETDSDIVLNEGDTYISSVVFADPGSDTWTATVDYGDGTDVQVLMPASDMSFDLHHTFKEDGNYTVLVEVCDEVDCGTATTNVVVHNVAPEIMAIDASGQPMSIGDVIIASAEYTDPGVSDTHTAIWDWGDGSSSNGLVAAIDGSGTVTGEHVYAQPGVYTVTVMITDDDGGVGTATYEYVVIYDPAGGFVTGGGWIDSPAGAYLADPSLTGKANFGFVSKYKKGANVPTGNTEFQFKAGDLNFHSDSYDWLVVNQGGANAQFKGSGTINGELAPTGELYRFMIWAGDGSPDTFRIRVWYEESGSEIDVYDNGFDQPISGGSIVIHSK